MLFIIREAVGIVLVIMENCTTSSSKRTENDRSISRDPQDIYL